MLTAVSFCQQCQTEIARHESIRMEETTHEALAKVMIGIVRKVRRVFPLTIPCPHRKVTVTYSDGRKLTIQGISTARQLGFDDAAKEGKRKEAKRAAKGAPRRRRVAGLQGS